jgi:hypothetical protein
MLLKPDLSPAFCIHAVVSATPSPSEYQQGSAAETKLFDLGVVDDESSQIFVEALKGRIFPWHIDNSDILGTPGTTVQAAADSVQNNAM